MPQLTYRIDVGDGSGGGITVQGGGWFDTEEQHQALLREIEAEADRIRKGLQDV